MSEAVRRDDEARCDRCGKPSPYDFGDRRVCEECHAVCESCCLELGADDLWELDDEPKRRVARTGAG